MSVDLSDIEPELSLSLEKITKWLFYLLCVQNGMSFSNGMLKICYGMMMFSILIPSICGNEKGHVFVCVRSRMGIESALLAVFGYDSMESGSDKRRPGVMSHIPCPYFLPSGLQMGREMPCCLSASPVHSLPSLRTQPLLSFSSLALFFCLASRPLPDFVELLMACSKINEASSAYSL